MAQPKEAPVQPVRTIPPLPGGLVQHREGIQRCGECQGEVVEGHTLTGAIV